MHITRKIVTALAALALGVVAAPTPAQATEPGCAYIGPFRSMPLSMPLGYHAGPWTLTPRSACTVVVLYVERTAVSGVWVEFSGTRGTWTYVPAGGEAVIARNVPDGYRYRVVFNNAVERFGVFD